jgi:hypothetical protein
VTDFDGVLGHHRKTKKRTDEWYTPPSIIAALGGWESFGLDPCAPVEQPYPTARAVYTKLDNGLLKPWFDRVWLNPPYTTWLLRAFLARMAEHGSGIALVFARTDTAAFQKFIWQQASAVLFLGDRLNFFDHYGIESVHNSGAPSVFAAYGQLDTDVLAAAAVDAEYDSRGGVIWPSDGRIPGQFIALRIPISVLIKVLPGTWREELDRAFPAAGTVRLDELYRTFADHPKARDNPNYQAKLRQLLQEGPYRRVARGLWEREGGTDDARTAIQQ